jgi:hypothetical protein
MEKDRSGNKSNPMECWSIGAMEYQKTEGKRSYWALLKSSSHYSTIPLLRKAKIPQSTRGGKQR